MSMWLGVEKVICMPKSVKHKPIWAYGSPSPHSKNYIQVLRKSYLRVESYIQVWRKLYLCPTQWSKSPSGLDKLARLTVISRIGRRQCCLIWAYGGAGPHLVSFIWLWRRLNLSVESYIQVWRKLYLWASHWSTSPSSAHPGVTRLKTWQHHSYPIAHITSPFCCNIREKHYGSITVSHGTAKSSTSQHHMAATFLPHGTMAHITYIHIYTYIHILHIYIFCRKRCIREVWVYVYKPQFQQFWRFWSSKVHASLSVKSPWLAKFNFYLYMTHVVYNTIQPPQWCSWYHSIPYE